MLPDSISSVSSNGASISIGLDEHLNQSGAHTKDSTSIGILGATKWSIPLPPVKVNSKATVYRGYHMSRAIWERIWQLEDIIFHHLKMSKCGTFSSTTSSKYLCNSINLTTSVFSICKNFLQSFLFRSSSKTFQIRIRNISRRINCYWRATIHVQIW